MRRNSVNPTSGLKTALTIVFSDHGFFKKGLKLWRFDNTISEFWAYFHRACAETAIFELPVKNLTPPFAPVISISYMIDAFPLPSDVYGIYSIFLCRWSHRSAASSTAAVPGTMSSLGDRSFAAAGQGRRLRGDRGDRPPQKVRWRGRKCFYPPQYLENVLQISM